MNERSFDHLIALFSKMKPYLYYSIVGALLGLTFDFVLSLQVIANQLILALSIFAIILLLLLGWYIRDASKQQTARFRAVLFGVALTSFVLTVIRFPGALTFFSNSTYRTAWNIDGSPYVYYPPDLVWGTLRSGFLGSVFLIIERCLKFVEDSRNSKRRR